jgi:hypothetical protein
LNGVDLVSTNYPSILSNCGLVFVLPNDEHFNDSESSEQISKRIRLENSSNTNSTLLEITLNMWDMKYRADKTPLVSKAYSINFDYCVNTFLPRVVEYYECRLKGVDVMLAGTYVQA